MNLSNRYHHFLRVFILVLVLALSNFNNAVTALALPADQPGNPPSAGSTSKGSGTGLPPSSNEAVKPSSGITRHNLPSEVQNKMTALANRGRDQIQRFGDRFAKKPSATDKCVLDILAHREATGREWNPLPIAPPPLEGFPPVGEVHLTTSASLYRIAEYCQLRHGREVNLKELKLHAVTKEKLATCLKEHCDSVRNYPYFTLSRFSPFGRKA